MLPPNTSGSEDVSAYSYKQEEKPLLERERDSWSTGECGKAQNKEGTAFKVSNPKHLEECF